MFSNHSPLLAMIVVSLLVGVRGLSYLKLDRRGISFDYNGSKVRGVNLGGWFVLEPWITPSLFEEWSTNQQVRDEYTYSQILGKYEAYKRLESHWNNWITESDFYQIRDAGLNHVRIPLGYWAVAPLPGDPYVQGQLEILDQAIGWARSAGLKVLIDLHCAPGSQNGFDNSGRLADVGWEVGDTIAQTLDALKNLSEHYASQRDVVSAIELLNEPLGPMINLDLVKDFYQRGYNIVRQSNADSAVVIHDAFEDFETFWNGFMNSQSSDYNVILDTHQYQIFSPREVSRSPTEHIAYACSLVSKLQRTDKWTVVGEWTGAQTDCAKWLNGLGKGARYDGTFPGSFPVGSCDGKYFGTAGALSSDDKYNIRRFVEAQLDAYESHTGWFFWTWKTESAPEWDMQDLIANELFPQPLEDRKYPGQCH